jgi:hypothetical protein
LGPSPKGRRTPQMSVGSRLDVGYSSSMGWFRGITLLVLFFLAQPGFPCSCIPRLGLTPTTMRESAEVRAKGSSTVFEGMVLQIALRSGTVMPVRAVSLTASGQQMVVKMQVQRTYRGVQGGTVTVVTGIGGGDCGFEFEVGKSYIVHADENPAGELFTSICTATEALDDAGPQLRVLRGEPPTSEDLLAPEQYTARFGNRLGRICGHFARSDGSTAKEEPVISIWRVLNNPVGARKCESGKTKSTGTYCSRPLAPGDYIVGGLDDTPWQAGIEYGGYYKNARQASAASRVTLQPGETLSDIDVVLHKNAIYTVRGRVKTDSGGPVPEDTRVAITSAEGELLFEGDDEGLESDGTFKFCCLPAGTYSLIAAAEDSSTQEGSAPKWRVAETTIKVKGDMSGIVLPLASGAPTTSTAP